MSKYLSDQNKLSFIYESGTYATASGVEWSIGLVQEHTPEENVNVIQIRHQGSTDRNVDQFVDGNLDYTGTFSYYPQDFTFLGFGIGSIAETATAGSHAFTETNTDDRIQTVANQSLTSFSLKDYKIGGTTGSNFIRTYNGCLVDSFTLTSTQGEPVTCEVGYIAQTTTFSSGASLGISGVLTTRPYMFSDVSLQIPSGTAMDNLTDVSFTVNNNIEPGHYLNGSRQIKEGLPMNRDYEVSNTYIIDGVNAKVLYDQYFAGGSTFNCMLKLAGTPGSAFIIMSGCKVSEMSMPSPLEGMQEQTMTFIHKV